MTQTYAEKLTLAFLGFIAFGYIISSAYLGTYGNHMHKQAYVYGHILGFTGEKDFSTYDLFNSDSKRKLFPSGKGIANIPVYEFIVGKISVLINSDPLVVMRFVNLFLWMIVAYFGFRLAQSWAARSMAGVIFVFLLATSPLFLHYGSVSHPDMMSIALAIVGMALLHFKGIGFRAVLYALPFLAVSALIKSPIAFIFVLFYGIYLALNIDVKKLFARETIIRHVPFAALLVILLGVALLAEQLRFLLTHGYFPDKFLLNPARYFGIWREKQISRFDYDFWITMNYRFKNAGPFNFTFVYLAVVFMSNMIRREKGHLIITIAAFATFFGGWLVFPVLFYYHDYYLLPVMVIIFLTFAVSFSYLIDELLKKIPEQHWQFSYAAVLLLLIPLSSYLVLTKESPSDRARARFHSGIEYALRNQKVFLYVNKRLDIRPTIGGKVSTKFKAITTAEFEEQCDLQLARYSAIYFVGSSSACLARNKYLADYYMSDQGLWGVNTIFFMRKK